ncbi:L,D-transpeptidase family protein [Bradyrhizobium sp. JYMT SZCCT0428]|uniref:L,D-transpeptidase family protein n=1 Tax=Bradyrhizobium sp. JYMT SZCCT0428 TaxID=2807673 RepID=UPI001BA9E457|nr:L,D-transpeptidase family protein [Bradyrhizobium sp. JYMT SZCCT0428]MBR1156140.1 L,D-transpeptidase family protein [Bradyrhizobium sp. JYMT SZCCT0428]
MNSTSVSSANQRFWQIAVLVAAGTIAASSHADAALYYWQDSDPSFYRPAPSAQPRKQRARKPPKAMVAAEKEISAKPQGPLIIAISINQQKVRVYDANGIFAESPVSTGTKSHPTPMGVFSIIQKHKMHHSNIYSGAPMPFMQRITWSGVAMHAGALPGYPASHGCIRLPMAFAAKMWNWTKMGARVIVTPGEMTPSSFSHPLLVAQKVVPQPVAADEPMSDAPAVKSDKGADAGSAIKPAQSEASLELRSTVGHGSPDRTPLRERTHTADASGAMPATNAAATMSDASPSASRLPASGDAAAEVTSAESKPSEAATAEVKSIETGDDMKAAEARVETKPEDAKPEVAKSETAEVEAKSADVKPDEVRTGTLKADAPKVEAPKAEAPKAAEKPAEPVKAIADTPAVAPDAKKDPSRLPGVEKAAAKPEPKRTGQIAVFVSRKDGKLYVRQNFTPLFDVPVTIAPSERMLGTHVFTAEVDKKDPNLLRWSVVSLPVSARNAALNEEDERAARRRKVAGGAPAEAKPVPAPNSPAEALDRITVPPEAMARIAEALTTGGSIVVSDHGINTGETGEGTDFIVPLR